MADINEYIYQPFLGTACLFSALISATICASCFSSFAFVFSGIMSGVRLSVTPSSLMPSLSCVTESVTFSSCASFSSFNMPELLLCFMLLPQLLQNIASSGFSVPHLLQNIAHLLSTCVFHVQYLALPVLHPLPPIYHP